MRMKTRTLRRLVLAGVAVVLVVGCAFTLVVVRGWQRERATAEYRRTAIAAAEKGEWYEALGAAGSYIKRSRATPDQDPEAVLVYARARAAVEESDGSHLREASRFYQQYVDARPDDREARVTLLDLYMRAGFYPEAKDVAERLLPSDLSQAGPESVHVLSQYAKALYASKAPAERVNAALDRLFALDPLDVDGAILRLEMLGQGGNKVAPKQFAERLQLEHQNDPRVWLVAALSRLQAGTPDDVAAAQKLLERGAGLDAAGRRVTPVTYKSVPHAERLVNAFDALGAFTHSRAVLADAQPLGDLNLSRMLVRRLWQEGAAAEILEQLSSLRADDRRADAELLGFKALAHVATGQHDQAKPLVDALRAREGELRAVTMVAVVTALDPKSAAPPLEAIPKLRDATRQNPSEPLLHYALGEALAAVGRGDEAREAYRAAREARAWDGTPIARSWSTPLVRTAETLLTENRAIEAAAAATQALATAPTSLVTNVVYLQSQAARLKANGTEGPEPRALVSWVAATEEALNAVPAPQASTFRELIAAPKIVFLSRAGQRDAAVAAAREAIERHAASPAVLRAIAAASQGEGLGVEREAMAKAESTGGETAEVLLARAVDLADAGRVDEATAALRSAAEKNADKAPHALALALFLEGRDDAAALAQWRRVLERFGNDAAAVRGVLASPAASQDAALIDRAIERHLALTGREAGEDTVIRLARARVALRGPVERASRDRAVTMLSEVVQASPTLVEPRVLLAAAYTLSAPEKGVTPDYERAVAQLTAALASDARAWNIQLELARLQLIRGEADRARTALLAVLASAPRDARVAAADMLLASGDAAGSALPAIEALRAEIGERFPVATLARLADAHRAAGNAEKAREAFTLVAARATDTDSLLAASRYFSAAGDAERAEAAMRRVAEVDARPWSLPLARARLLAERGDADGADRQFQEAMKTAGSAPEPHRVYAEFLLRVGRVEDAARLADAGLKGAPGDAALSALAAQAQLIATPSGEEDLGPLIQALGGSAAHADLRAALQVYQQASKRGELNTVQQMLQVVDRAPGSVPLMLMIARRLEPLDAAQAADLATRAARAAGGDPAPARFQAELLARQQRWPEVLTAAREWRRRDRSASADADIAIAQALLATGQPAEAVKVLEPYAASASASPDAQASVAVLAPYALALVQAGDEARARRELRPLLASSRSVRVLVWANLACRFLTPYTLAASWVDELKPAIPPGDAEEAIAVIMLRLDMARRFPDRATSIAADAKGDLERLLTDPKTATASAFESMGVLLHRDNDTAGAERRYREAIRLDAKRVTSLNNLADILAQRGELDEALRLASAARDLAPANPGVLDTLAGIEARRAQRLADAGDPGARAAFATASEAYRRVAELAPADYAPLARHAELADRAGDRPAAAAAYERLLSKRGFPAAYHAAAKNNLAALLLVLNRGPGDLTRALALATEAAGTPDADPAFADTLAWARLASGQRDAALRDFRAVLATPKASAETLSSAKIGLARALAGGTPEERQEAVLLVDQLAGVSLPPTLADKLADTRKALGR